METQAVFVVMLVCLLHGKCPAVEKKNQIQSLVPHLKNRVQIAPLKNRLLMPIS